MIKVYNRNIKNYEIENVAGKKYIDWCYSSPVGKSFTELLIKRKLPSKVIGAYYNTSLSKGKIKNFVKEFDIDMSLATKNIDDYTSFNDFFYRTLTDDARPIPKDPNILISPGDGRLSAFDNIDMNNLVQVKGFTYSLKELLGDNELAKEFDGGVCFILRLCPTDYHRFHFIDNGVCGKTTKINGSYYSVNPVALKNIPKLFVQNKREWSVLKSENFGDVINVEVGATCVGSIIQTYIPGAEVKKGAEKGYFKFGGSTTILFFKKDTIVVDKEILEQTKLGYETKVLLGEAIGKKKA